MTQFGDREFWALTRGDGELWGEVLVGLMGGAMAPNSKKAYRSDMEHFCTWLGAQAGELTRELVIGYRDALAEVFADATVSRRMTVVRLFCRQLVRKGLLPDDPTEGVRTPPAPREGTTPALSRGQYLDLVDAARRDPTPRGLRDVALIRFAFRTGLRKAELLDLTADDFGSDQGHTVVTYRAKGGGEKRTKVPLALRADLQSWLDMLSALGGTADGPSPIWRGIRGPRTAQDGLPWTLTPGSLSRFGLDTVLRSRSAQAELPLFVTPHVLRATFITLALDAGASLHRVQYAAGHADPRTTERYDRKRLNLDDHATDYLGDL